MQFVFGVVSIDGTVVRIGVVDSDCLKVLTIDSIVVSSRDVSVVIVDNGILFGINVVANCVISVSFSSNSVSSMRFFTK